jgi:TRAP-type C4-dicarboxylate transport system permease small subunit
MRSYPKWLERLADVLTFIGVIALAIMMLSTVADVVLRALFRLPIKGTFDAVSSFLVPVIFCGMPAGFLRGRQIAVDIIDNVTGERLLSAIKFGASIVALLFLVMLIWHMVSPALDAYRFGDRKSDFPTPLYLLWLVMLVSVASSILMLGFVAARQAVALFREQGKT